MLWRTPAEEDKEQEGNYETSLKRLLNIPKAAEANLELSNLSNSPHSH